MTNNTQQNKQISIPREFYISSDTEYIFVSDFFVEDYIGGAELTLEAIYNVAPSKSTKIHSSSLTEDMISEHRHKTWILVNFTNAPKDILSFLVQYKCKYIVIEPDYKFCKFRSEHHHVHVTGQQCECHLDKTQGKWIEAFYKRAHRVFFMSESQMNRYITLFPALKDVTNFRVQYSTWNESDLEYIVSLSLEETKEYNDTWAILSGNSWIKNQQSTELYCKTNNMKCNVLPRLPYREFLKELSKYKGLVFHPSGYDTCPRLVIEAKMLGLELDINDNVQMKYEEWFSKKDQFELFQFLKERPKDFWKKVI